MTEISDPLIIERYQQLIKAMTDLTAILNPEKIYEYLVDAAVSLTQAELAWILSPDKITHTLNMETGSFTNGHRKIKPAIPIDDTLEGWVYTHQQPVIINDTSQYDRQHGRLSDFPGYEIKNLLIIPIAIRKRRIIILEVANKIKEAFTQADMEMLASLGHHAVICVDKSRHFVQSDLIPEFVHELRTPLAALNTALHLLQRPDLPGEKREQISQIIQTEFIRLTEMATSFLDYSRLESGKEKYRYTHFDLGRLISESIDVIQMQFENREMNISVSLPDEPLFISADRDKIKQVILNLVNNAMKYNNPGGIITINAQASPTHITFSIQDDGQGIPPEYLPRLFERFYRMPDTERQVKGTGLGLTICKHIVEAHNGKIEVSSMVGQGSKFTVQLPVNGEE